MSSYQEHNGKKNDTAYWVIAVVLVATGIAAPVGILMIVLKLLTRNKKRGRHPYYVQREAGGPGARTTAGETAPEEAARPAKKRRGGKKSAGTGQDLVRDMAASAKGMTTGGAALSAAFGCMAVINAADNLWMLPDVLWYLEEIIPLLCFTTVGLGILWAGLRRRKQAHRYRSYLAMIGQKRSISISSLASATGSPVSRIWDDLEDMLDDGFFPAGFLDRGSGRLVISGDGLEDAPDASAGKNAAEETAPAAEDAVLAEIRAVSGAVDNPRLSAQIDRIGDITAKILEYQRSRPEKAPQLHSFLSYYLPTTLKILRAYSQLEDQEVCGENITSAMGRIEGMMDKVVEGFEKQLDQLFQGDAMDITTDVEVLERMLAKDGLSDHQGMTLGL